MRTDESVGTRDADRTPPRYFELTTAYFNSFVLLILVPRRGTVRRDVADLGPNTSFPSLSRGYGSDTVGLKCKRIRLEANFVRGLTAWFR